MSGAREALSVTQPGVKSDECRPRGSWPRKKWVAGLPPPLAWGGQGRRLPSLGPVGPTQQEAPVSLACSTACPVTLDPILTDVWTVGLGLGFGLIQGKSFQTACW